MRILHINTFDLYAGAARAVYRLHKALLASGVDSMLLVQSKAGDDKTVWGPESQIGKGMGLVRPMLDQIPLLRYPKRKKGPFHPAWLPFAGVLRKIEEIDPDIVHLHWIARGFVRIEQLAKIRKPIVWSLHDMWAFTGGCHYDGGCGKYEKMCGNCPVLGSGKDKDLSRRVFLRKQSRFSKLSRLTVNGLSSWLAECAGSSSLLQNTNVLNLPNPIDTETYKPLARDQAKELLGFSAEKKHILFGAMNATSEERKGFAELIQAIDSLSADDIELAVLGSSKPENVPRLPFQSRYLGRLHDDLSLRILYSAADVVVVPSRQENLSNTCLEALACGTPVVGFDIGGNRDMIDHRENGYLAAPFDPKDLASGIEFCLYQADAQKMRENARSKVLRNFDSQLVADRYIALYKSILRGGK